MIPKNPFRIAQFYFTMGPENARRRKRERSNYVENENKQRGEESNIELLENALYDQLELFAFAHTNAATFNIHNGNFRQNFKITRVQKLQA